MKILTPQMFKNDLYLSKQSDGQEYDDNGKLINAYQEPIAFKGRHGINYQPLTAESDIQRYGASSQEIVKAVIMNTDKAYKHFTQDSVGDLVYLFGASPTVKPKWDKSPSMVEGKHGYWANYEVDAVLPMIHHVNVFFKKNKRTGVL